MFGQNLKSKKSSCNRNKEVRYCRYETRARVGYFFKVYSKEDNRPLTSESWNFTEKRDKLQSVHKLYYEQKKASFD